MLEVHGTCHSGRLSHERKDISQSQSYRLVYLNVQNGSGYSFLFVGMLVEKADLSRGSICISVAHLLLGFQCR